MTKQEDVFYILQEVRIGNLSEYEATLKLQELGVVIKVEKELPMVSFTLSGYMTPSELKKVGDAYRKAYAGCVTVESLLVEEEQTGAMLGFGLHPSL